MEGRDQRKSLTKSGLRDGYSELSTQEQGAFKPEWRRQSTALKRVSGKRGSVASVTL